MNFIPALVKTRFYFESHVALMQRFWQFPVGFYTTCRHQW